MSDFESDLASIADYVNILCREVGVVETPNYDYLQIKSAICRIVNFYKLRYIFDNH